MILPLQLKAPADRLSPHGNIGPRKRKKRLQRLPLKRFV